MKASPKRLDLRFEHEFEEAAHRAAFSFEVMEMVAEKLASGGALL